MSVPSARAILADTPPASAPVGPVVRYSVPTPVSVGLLSVLTVTCAVPTCEAAVQLPAAATAASHGVTADRLASKPSGSVNAMPFGAPPEMSKVASTFGWARACVVLGTIVAENVVLPLTSNINVAGVGSTRPPLTARTKNVCGPAFNAVAGVNDEVHGANAESAGIGVVAFVFVIVHWNVAAATFEVNEN